MRSSPSSSAPSPSPPVVSSPTSTPCSSPRSPRRIKCLKHEVSKRQTRLKRDNHNGVQILTPPLAQRSSFITRLVFALRLHMLEEIFPNFVTLMRSQAEGIHARATVNIKISPAYIGFKHRRDINFPVSPLVEPTMAALATPSTRICELQRIIDPSRQSRCCSRRNPSTGRKAPSVRLGICACSSRTSSCAPPSPRENPPSPRWTRP